MILETSDNMDCVAASLAMLLRIGQGSVKRDIFHDPPIYPFPSPWQDCPMVPSMDVICDYCWQHRKRALVPFEYDPHCTPHPDCPTEPVWPEHPDTVFARQLAYGPGLLEGRVDDRGHMCAWDGHHVFDPRGYTYSINVADRFDFVPARFWLAVKGPTC